MTAERTIEAREFSEISLSDSKEFAIEDLDPEASKCKGCGGGGGSGPGGNCGGSCAGCKKCK